MNDPGKHSLPRGVESIAAGSIVAGPTSQVDPLNRLIGERRSIVAMNRALRAIASMRG